MALQLSTLGTIIRDALAQLAGGQRLPIDAVDGVDDALAGKADVALAQTAIDSASSAQTAASAAQAAAEAASSTASNLASPNAIISAIESAETPLSADTVRPPSGYRHVYVKAEDLEADTPYDLFLTGQSENSVYMEARVVGVLPPVMLTAPALTGTGKISAALALSDGSWQDSPITITKRYLRDGVEISGATGAAYTPVAADDGKTVTGEITAMNSVGGRRVYTTSGIAISYTPPTVATAIPAKILSQIASGYRSISLSGVFSQPGAITVSGSSAVTVADDNDSLSVNVNALIAATTITVTCTNSGGAVSTTFSLTVVAAQAEWAASGGSATTNAATFTAYKRDALIIANAKRHSDGTAITVPDLTTFTDEGKWVVISATADGTGGYAVAAYRRAQSDGADGSLGTWTNAASVVYTAYDNVDWTDPIGAVAGGFQAGAANTDYPALTVEATNSVIHQYASIETNVTTQNPSPPTGYIQHASTPTNSGVHYSTSSSPTPAATRAAINDVAHTVAGTSGSIYTHAVEIRGATSAGSGDVPATIASGKWAASEVTDPAEAETAGFAGSNGRIKVTFASDIVTTVTNSSGTYTLVLAAKGAALGSSALVVTSGMVTNGYYTSSGSTIGASVSPKLGWRKGEGATAEYFDAGSKGPIAIVGLTGAGAVVVEITTKTALGDAIAAAVPGTVISIAPGDYAGIEFRNVSKGTRGRGNEATWVTLRPKDRANPPKFQGTVEMSGSKGFIIDGLYIDGSKKLDQTRGTQKTAEFPSGSLVATMKGMQLNDAEDIWIKDNLFRFCHEGIRADRTKRVTVEYNTHEYWGMDPLRMFGSQEAPIVRGNVTHKSLVYMKEALVSDRHPDTIMQCAINGNDGSIDDLLVEMNYGETLQFSDGSAQGDNAGGKSPAHGMIFMCNAVRPGPTPAPGSNGDGKAFTSARSYNRLTIRNNEFYGSDVNGIAIEAVMTGRIYNNWMRTTPAGGTSDSGNPNIYLYGNFFLDVDITNNVNVNETVPSPPAPNSDPTKYAAFAHWSIGNDATKMKYSGFIKSASAKPVGYIDLVRSNAADGKKPVTPTGNCGQYAIR